MTMGNSVRSAATGMATAAFLVLSMVLIFFLEPTWAIVGGGAGALVFYVILHIFWVAPFEDRYFSNLTTAPKKPSEEQPPET